LRIHRPHISLDELRESVLDKNLDSIDHIVSVNAETLVIEMESSKEVLRVSPQDPILLEIVCEALVKGRKMNIRWGGEELDLGRFIERLSSIDSLFLEKATVCADLKNRGRNVRRGPDKNSLLVKTGSKDYDTLVYIVSQNQDLKLTELASWSDNKRRLSLETLLAVVDMYGDVTYYSFSALHKLK